MQWQSSFNNVFCFFHQLQTTVCETPVTEETELQDLTTITMEALSRLNEEVPIEIGSPVLQAATSTATPVGKELIGTCATPTKIKTVQHTLGKESEWHLCALKLLPNFFSKEELATSNTDGTYDKDKAWRFIKSKINSKCRTTCKHLAREFSPQHSPWRVQIHANLIFRLRKIFRQNKFLYPAV